VSLGHEVEDIQFSANYFNLNPHTCLNIFVNTLVDTYGRD
jgi:hypothetical protein